MASGLVLYFPGEGGVLEITPFRSPWADGGDSKCGEDAFVPFTGSTSPHNPLRLPDNAEESH